MKKMILSEKKEFWRFSVFLEQPFFTEHSFPIILFAQAKKLKKRVPEFERNSIMNLLAQFAVEIGPDRVMDNNVAFRVDDRFTYLIR